jgi:hypothetical protein
MDFLSHVISLTDQLHLPVAIETRADQHKEWYHFCLLGPGVEVILNLSLMRPADQAASAWDARVIMLVRETDWDGDVDIIPGAHVKARRGGLEIQLGHNSMQFKDGCFSISLALQKRPITLTAMLRPMAYPLTRRNVPIGKGKISWVVVPRLQATGTLVVGRRVYRLENAPAYHDHNWGQWHWGDDFSWQWGFALPPTDKTPWSLVFDQMTDRGRNHALELKLTLWKGSQLHRLFMHEELHVQQEGFRTLTRPAKFPRPMALVAHELTTEVPAHFQIQAARSPDWLNCRFSADDLAQIILPNELDLGVTTINEVTGSLRMEGEIKGEQVSMEGRGFFEFLT